MDQHDATRIGARLAQALEARGMSQSSLARALDVNRQAVQQLIAGHNKNPSASRIFRVAEVVRVSPRWLVLGKGEMDIDSTSLHPDEEEMLTLARMLPDDRRAELLGYVRGLVASSAHAGKSLQQSISSMQASDAAQVKQLLGEILKRVS